MSEDLSQYGTVELAKYGDVDAAPRAGAVSRFLEPLNPMPLVHALFKPAEDPHEPYEMTFARNVAHVVKDMGLAQLDQGRKALDAWDKGDHTSAVAHGMAALTPILGPISQQAADKFNEGDIAGGMGSLTSMALPEILHQVPKVAGAIKSGAQAVAEAATKPGTGKVIIGAGQLAGAPAALATGHPIVAGGLAVRGLENVRKGMEARSAVAPPPIPPLWDELAGPGGYAKLSPAEQALIQKIATRMDGAAPAEAAAPKAPRDLSHYGVVEPATEPLGPISRGTPPDVMAARQTEMRAAMLPPKPAPAAPEAPTPAGGLTDPAYAPEPMQPPLSLPGGQGQAIPPDVSRATLSPAQELAQSLTGSPEGGTIAPEASPHPPSDAFEGAYRAKRAQILADHFHENGISYGDLANLTPEDLSPSQWEALLGKDPQTGNQFRAPSQKTIDQARVLLSHKSAAARTPESLGTAQELAAAVEEPAPKPKSKVTTIGEEMKRTRRPRK